jgi:hypothetical protein
MKKNVFFILKEKEIKYNKRKVYKKIPNRLLIPYSNIEDNNKSLRKTCLIGFSRNGNFLITYEFLNNYIYLVIWRFSINNTSHMLYKIPFFGNIIFN